MTLYFPRAGNQVQQFAGGFLRSIERIYICFVRSHFPDPPAVMLTLPTLPAIAGVERKMPRSGFYTQRCPCGGDHRPVASVTLAASTLRVTPRRKSRSITVYICDQCLKNPKPKARRAFTEAVLMGAHEAIS